MFNSNYSNDSILERQSQLMIFIRVISWNNTSVKWFNRRKYIDWEYILKLIQTSHNNRIWIRNNWMFISDHCNKSNCFLHWLNKRIFRCDFVVIIRRVIRSSGTVIWPWNFDNSNRHCLLQPPKPLELILAVQECLGIKHYFSL